MANSLIKQICIDGTVYDIAVGSIDKVVGLREILDDLAVEHSVEGNVLVIAESAEGTVSSTPITKIQVSDGTYTIKDPGAPRTSDVVLSINGKKGTVTIGLNKTTAKVVTAINAGSGSFTPTTKYLHKSTTNVAPNAHTHTVTVSGTTGANNGTAVTAVTGVGSNGTATVLTGVKASTTDTFLKDITEGSGSLIAQSENADGRIQYVESITSTGASSNGTATVLKGVKASGSDTFLKTINGGSGSLVAYDAATNGTAKVADGTRIPVVTSVTHTAASLTGTKTFATTGIKSVSLSASTTNTDGPAYISEVTHTAASLTGTTTFVTAQGTFSAGTTPVSSASPTATSTNSGSAGSTTIGSYSAGVLTINDVANHTHTYDKTTGITLTRGTAPSLGAATTGSVGISGGSINSTTKYMKVSTTPASTASVGISGGSITPTTYYLEHKHTGASNGTTAKAITGVTSDGTATVLTGIKGGTTTATYKYLEHTHIPSTEGSSASAVTAVAANGTTSVLTGVKATGTASVAPSGHTHSYGSSTALTSSANSGSAVAAITGLAANTTSATGDITYLESATHTHTGASVKTTEDVIKTVEIE
jgi:hypothetical protein